MATSTIKKYTTVAELQDYWIKNIAPNYFDFENLNNYRSGVFGYINEVMSTVSMDAFNAINLARREFYPVTALNPKSLYKMAALQMIDLPLAVPSVCNAVLILDQEEVVNNSKYKNGVYTCVIDNTVQILAGNVSFSFLYPIIIASKLIDGVWNHTIHYDKSFRNDLDTDTISNYHIMNRVINKDGTRYILLSVQLTQVKKERVSDLVSKDASIDTVSMVFKFNTDAGNLANFEVFYIEDPDTSKPIQLVKLMNGQVAVKEPFCYYRLLGDDQLEITFPKSSYFIPELNSEIAIDFYTALGKGGDFVSFSDGLSCTMKSEDYPYNNNMHMYGNIDGSSILGENRPTLEEYTKTIQIAYATNNTIVITNDLQLLFNKISSSYNKVIFRKKRDDAFDREFGAYILVKTEHGDIVPTNTLTIKMTLEEFDNTNGITRPAILKPGTLFEYDGNVDENEIFTVKVVDRNELTIRSDLTPYDFDSDRFIYTNPFLIYVTLYPNFIQYFNTSMKGLYPIEYSYTNDDSLIQFIGGSFSVERNSLAGENFYVFSIRISPTNEVPQDQTVIIPGEDDEDLYIRAEENGQIHSVVYDSDEEAVICTIVYDNGEEDTIQVGSKIVNEEGEYSYEPGYTLRFNVFDTFVKGDILATKKVTDLGKIRACINIKPTFYENELYIPMIIEEFDISLNAYILRGYISTDDVLDNDGHLLIDHGIYDSSGHEDEEVSIFYEGLKTEIHIFYQNDDVNYPHTYSSFDYFKEHTLVNTYEERSNDGISLIETIDYIHSTLLFTEDENSGPEYDPDEEDDEDIDEAGFSMVLKEVPMVKASWMKDRENFNYFIDSILTNYKNLIFLKKKLENGFGFDMKFYNSYGKSRFFKVGIRNQFQPLSRVDSTFRFGVYLISSSVSQTSFLESFRKYVKDAVEAINKTSSEGQSIYILNLVADIEKAFSEIGYMEYYGFNEYSNNIQKIEPVGLPEMGNHLLMNYIPEFINVGTYKENNQVIPNISVEFLNYTEENEDEARKIERME